jgi:hypothetical protein
MPAVSAARRWRVRTPSPITASTPPNPITSGSPAPAARWLSQVFRRRIQRGSASRPSWRSPVSAYTGANQNGTTLRTASPTQSTAHTQAVPRSPSVPEAAIALPPSGDRAGSRGHATNASSAYRRAGPGPPTRSVALPANTPPRPSPSHQTPSAHGIDAASASVTVRRHSRPAASASWTVMIAAFSSTGYGASRCEAVTSEPKIGWGWCSALPRASSRPQISGDGDRRRTLAGLAPAGGGRSGRRRASRPGLTSHRRPSCPTTCSCSCPRSG